jgi:hypothetical protein
MRLNLTREQKLLAAAILAVVAAILLYAVYLTSQKRAQHRSIVALLDDTSTQLRSVFAEGAGKGQAAKIEADLKALKELKASRYPVLAELSEQYIISARAIAQRQEELPALDQQAMVRRKILNAHMRTAEHRGTGWIREALEHKKKVEADYFALERNLKALDELLLELPATTKRLATDLQTASPLVDIAEIRAARQKVQDELQRSAVELDQVRRLGTPR